MIAQDLDLVECGSTFREKRGAVGCLRGTTAVPTGIFIPSWPPPKVNWFFSDSAKLLFDELLSMEHASGRPSDEVRSIGAVSWGSDGVPSRGIALWGCDGVSSRGVDL